MSSKLTLLSLVIAPLLTLALQPLLRKLRRGYRRLRSDYGEIDERASGSRERHSAREVVRRRAVRGRRFSRREPSLLATAWSASIASPLLSQPLTEIIGTSIAVLILWIGAQRGARAAPRIDARDAHRVHDRSSCACCRRSSSSRRRRRPRSSRSPRPSGCSRCSISRPRQQRDRGTRDGRDASSERSSSTASSFAYDDRARAAATSASSAPKGPVVALVGAERGGEEHARRPDPALLRADRGAHPARRRRHARHHAGVAARADRHRQSGHRAVQRHGAQQHRLRRGRASIIARADRARGARGQRARLHQRAAERLRHRPRRTRHASVGRPAPATGDRARAARRSADPHPRRSDVGARHRVRAPRAGGGRPTARRAHGVRHRAPAVDRSFTPI